jgi:hypothetical protein
MTLIEIWKMLTVAGDKWVWLLLGTAAAAVRTGPMVHRLFGWQRASKLLLKVALTLLNRLPQRQTFLPQKKVANSHPRVCDLPRCGAARKRNWAENDSCIEQRCEGSGGAYVEDHKSRFGVTGSSNHGCNESRRTH